MLLKSLLKPLLNLSLLIVVATTTGCFAPTSEEVEVKRVAEKSGWRCVPFSKFVAAPGDYDNTCIESECYITKLKVHKSPLSSENTVDITLSESSSPNAPSISITLKEHRASAFPHEEVSQIKGEVRVLLVITSGALSPRRITLRAIEPTQPDAAGKRTGFWF